MTFRCFRVIFINFGVLPLFDMSLPCFYLFFMLINGVKTAKRRVSTGCPKGCQKVCQKRVFVVIDKTSLWAKDSWRYWHHCDTTVTPVGTTKSRYFRVLPLFGVFWQFCHFGQTPEVLTCLRLLKHAKTRVLTVVSQRCHNGVIIEQ